MNTSPINLQEEYAKTEIAKILNLLDEELVGLSPVSAVSCLKLSTIINFRKQSLGAFLTNSN
jgi:hypothetical protein